MRLSVTQGELNKHLLSFDNIHDHTDSSLDINDPTLVDITELGVRLALLAESQKNNVSQKQVMVTPQAEKASRLLRMNRNERQALKTKIQENHRQIRNQTLETHSVITPRTQAKNTKSPYTTVDEERAERSEVLSAQIRTWRSLLPTVIRRFSWIPDPRRPRSIKHSLVMLMLYGLLAFVFQLNSRREMNRVLTGPLIHEHLRKIFPEIDSIPHADTLGRLLKRINPKKIEATHVSLIQELIRKKKFKNFLINNCLPISIDGTQKLYRNGLLQDDHWCERNVGNVANSSEQQYVYVLEANITLSCGLTIPLLSEYLYRDNNVIINPNGKQDCEITAFERMAERLKKYFPRQKIVLFMDSLFATQNIMELNDKNGWEYMITLPKSKLKNLAKELKKYEDQKITIPNQSHYRERQQKFYWANNIGYGYTGNVRINLLTCCETYYEVNKKTGEIETLYSEHSFISSMPININNIHELCNLGARKLGLMEDSINSEKNRGYHYQHAFAYDWTAMQGFHYLMRLGHAINALSEFTKKLKQSIKTLGCRATLQFIKDTLFSPWLSNDWYEAEQLKNPQLRLQLE